MDMVADRVLASRRQRLGVGATRASRTRRCMSIAALGGATLDNEENYLIKKLLTSLGIIQIENQARVCHSSTVVGLGTSFGRGASTHDARRSAALRPDRARGLEHGRGAPGRVPVGDGGQGARGDRHPRRPALQPHERAGRHLRSAARGNRHRVPRRDHQPRPDRPSRTSASTCWRTPTRRRSSARSSRTPAPTGCSRATTPRRGSYDPASWQYEGAFVAAAAGQRDQEGSIAATCPTMTRRAARARTPTPRPDAAASALRLADPQAPLRLATRPRWSSASAASRRSCSRGSASCSSRTPAASARPRSCTASAGRSTRSARSTSAPRRSCSCCWATSAGPAAA